MKRILIVSMFFPPSHGGIERTVEALARHFGDVCTVVAPPHEAAAAYDGRQPFRVRRTTFFERGQWPSWRRFAHRLERIAAEERSELVLFGHYAPYARVGSRLQTTLGIPTAIYLHGFDFLAYTPRWVHRQLLRATLGRATYVLVNSRWTSRQLAPYLSPWRHGLLYPSIDVDRCTPQDPPMSHTLVSIGRWTPIKGFDVALDAVAQLRRTFPDVHYTLFGSGEEADALRTQADALGLDQSVTFRTSPSGQEWCGALGTSSILLQPSRSIVHETYVQEESFGIAALEAGAAGRAVVATNAGGVPEAVRDGETGLLVRPDDPTALADAVASLWRHPDRLRRLGAQGRQRAAERFARPQFLERFERLVGLRREQPKVSVCLPARNAARTLEPTLESLLAQDYPNLEWIVVDDGSEDATSAIATRDPRVRLIRGHGRGAAVARNLAAEHATGELLYFSDDDCRHRHDAVRTLVETLTRHPDTAFAYSSFTLGWKRFRLRPWNPWALWERNFISTRALIRRRDFPGFDASIRRLQDWDLWLTMAEQGKRGVWVDKVLYRQDPRSSSMSSHWFPKFLYRFPRLADRLSRGAGMSLRTAEAIVRERHRDYLARRQTDPALTCPRCQTRLADSFPATCGTCGVVFSAPEGIPGLLHPTYLTKFKRTEVVAHSDRKVTIRLGTRNHPYHWGAKAWLLKLPAGSRVLEVACGNRPDGIELAQRGYRVTATDIAASRLATARNLVVQLGLAERMHFLVADAEHLPFPDRSFDAVLTAASFHHFPHQANALRELRRVVRPGGLVVLELEPQRWPYRTVFRVLRPLQRFFRSREHDVQHSIGDDQTDGFSEAQLRSLCRNANLEILDLQRVKLLSELSDQTARLIGKFFGRDWEAPVVLQTLLATLDRGLVRLPVVNRLAWHWNLIARVL